ncbi:MAG: chorismate synthase [Planctomycetota bacterium]|nr:chorismate synthase [Planctomycetota bacterium]
MSSSFGRMFVVTIFGESHGGVIGTVIDGCPAGVELTTSDIQSELERRRGGYSEHSTSRREPDRVKVLSGIFKNHTTGAPICIVVENTDVDSSTYEEVKDTPRPGHADYTAYLKYGEFSDYRGGGRFSGRLTAALVMAGAVAKKVLSWFGVRVFAYVTCIADVVVESKNIEKSVETVMRSRLLPFPCPDSSSAKKMLRAIEEARKRGDSVGGIIECVVVNPPPALGEPFFDTFDGDLAKILFSIPAVKGVEFGAGFRVASLKGSENNDPFTIENGKVVTRTNNCGGILGGITNGMPLVFRVAVKPTPSIYLKQETVNLKTMRPATIKLKGRYDPCIVPRAVVVVESVAAVVLLDHLLLQRGSTVLGGHFCLGK